MPINIGCQGCNYTSFVNEMQHSLVLLIRGIKRALSKYFMPDIEFLPMLNSNIKTFSSESVSMA